ncbi:MAG TPA: hypothetical protein VFN82_05915 [Solirubrobacterales bacterium]|nr:hypothetical protein [Solirubrobacterales bacterium]
MRKIRWVAAVAGVIAALLSLTGVAAAATITYSGGNSGTVIYTADPGEQLETLVGYEDECLVGYDCVTFSGDAISSAPAPCAPESSGESCLLDPDHSGVHVVGGSGEDEVSSSTRASAASPPTRRTRSPSTAKAATTTCSAAAPGRR